MDLKHLFEDIRKQEKSDHHLNSSVKFAVFGVSIVLTEHKASLEHHNKDFDKNRNF